MQENINSMNCCCSEGRHQVAVITGGSRGLGKSMVLNLAKCGVSSIFTYKSSEKDAKEVVSAVEAIQQIKQSKTKAIAIQLDTGNMSSFDDFTVRVKTALNDMKLDKIDFLVNNAGIASHAPFTEITEEELDLQYQVNFKGVFFLTQKLLPLIREGGKILNISTGLTRFVNPNSTAYASIKGAVEVFSRYMAYDLGKRNITVNTIAPGAIETDFSGGMVRDNPQLNKMVADMTALGRCGQPDDIGEMVAQFLTSGGTHWVNGQRIEVSGGMRL